MQCPVPWEHGKEENTTSICTGHWHWGPCVLQAWIQSCFAATPLYRQASLADCLSVCLGSEPPPQTKGVIYLRWWQRSPEQGAIAAALEALARGGSPWPLLTFFHLSHSNKSRAKEAAAARCLGQKQMVPKLLGEMYHALLPREGHTTKADLRCLLIFLLEVLKCSSKEKSTFFSWFWFAAGVCPFLT